MLLNVILSKKIFCVHKGKLFFASVPGKRDVYFDNRINILRFLGFKLFFSTFLRNLKIIFFFKKRK